MKEQYITNVSGAVQLGVPAQAYAALQVQDGTLHSGETQDGTFVNHEERLQGKKADEAALALLKRAAAERDLQYVAASLPREAFSPEFASRLWLEQDIVPLPFNQQESAALDSLENLVKGARAQFDEHDLAKVFLTPEREVIVSELVTLKDYRATVTEEDFRLVQRLAEVFKGKRLIFINATPQGGGVALMRHALIRFLRLLGVDAHWHILLPNSAVFDITKTKFHNVLQAVASPSTELTEDDKELFRRWSAENAKVFAPVFNSADVVVIDDPQPAGLIPFIKKSNPKAKVLYRSHIQIVASLATQEGTPQNKTWSFLWNYIRQADLFISHPMRMFVPSDVPPEKTFYMPATTDALDGLNKPLTREQTDIYLAHFNEILREQGQKPLDISRPYIVQIARFDPSKGIPDVLDAYRQLRMRLEDEHQPVPQLIIAGNGSVDDPDGVPVHNLIMRILRTEPYINFADDVKVARLPHRDQVLNTLLRRSKVVLQLSIKEGFEIKVTEALMKGKPVIAYKTGGIPLQIEDHLNGYLVDVGDTMLVSDHLYHLFTDDVLYERMCEAAATMYNKDYLTIPNAICWLYLSVALSNGETLTGDFQWVKSLATAAFRQKIIAA